MRVDKTVELRADPSSVWRALTDPDLTVHTLILGITTDLELPGF